MNYTRTAKHLHITQPAVSQHIHWVEQQYGVTLFNVQGKKRILTGEGRLLFELASALCVDERRIREKLKESLHHKTVLKLGATLTVGEYLMPTVLKGYLRDYPHTDISMQVKNTESLLTMLKEGEIEAAAIEGNFDKQSFGYRRISKEPYIGVCGAEFAGRKRPLSWAELFETRLIIREEGSGTREIFQQFLQEHNHKLKDFSHLIEVSNMGALKAMAVQNVGITFLYQRAVFKELLEGRLFPLQIPQFHLEREFYFVYLKDSIFADRYDTIFQYFMNRESS